tara:strand:+ start:24301 stop:25812 length:1512 start_codon:yes stop_codon:yes gene_type:complete
MNSESHLFEYDEWRPNLMQAKVCALWDSCRHPIIGLMAGWGAGKTTLTAMIAEISHLRNPGIDGFIVTDSMSRGARTVATQYERLLSPLGWVYKHAYKGQPAPHWLSPPLRGKRTKVWILSWKRPAGAAKSANSLEGPDCGWGVADECNTLAAAGEEVAIAMLGRVRSAKKMPRILLIGKPQYNSWWLRFSESRPGGKAIKAPSSVNRANLPAFDEWMKTLSRREVLESLLCQPQPPEGAVYNDWLPEVYPYGNIAPQGWTPDPSQVTHLAVDFGMRSPSGLVITQAPELGPGVSVIWKEAAPSQASVFDLATILKKDLRQINAPPVWPNNRNDAPPGAIPITSIVGDRAGRNRRDDGALSSSIDDLSQAPAVGGLGLRCRYTDDPKRVNVLSGIRILWRQICDNSGTRRLLCSHDLWHYGGELNDRSFAACITGYRWQPGSGKEVPLKDGMTDHTMDALRYWAINTKWPQDQQLRNAFNAFRGGGESISTVSTSPGPTAFDR